MNPVYLNTNSRAFEVTDRCCGGNKRFIRYSVFVTMLLLTLLMPTSLLAQTTPWCRAMEEAPKADLNDPAVKQAVDIWRKVNAPFESVTGRKTALAVLDRRALWNSQPFSTSAYLCSGAPAVVYVPYPLLDAILVERRYPEDLLAFVLAHELGHRFNDLDRTGQTTLQAFDRPGRGVNDEELADKRAAFYIAAAGYSTRKLAFQETVSFFLKSEFNYRPSDLRKRSAQLLNVLDTFDAYETVYQTALTLAFAEKRDTALRLLAWGDELVQGEGVALTEMKLARAQILMMEAAPYAPWITKAKLPVDVSNLRCLPMYPAHTALWEEPRHYSIARSLSRPEEARKLLIEAMWLLERADILGADPFVTASSKACVAFYLGDAPNAHRYTRDARERLDASTPASVRTALDANTALVAFLGYLNAHPFPDAPGMAPRWVKAANKERKTLGKNELVMGLLDLLATPASNLANNDESKRSPAKKTTDLKRGDIALFELPRHIPLALGGCPAGWETLFNTPVMGSDLAGATDMGLTACRPLSGDMAHTLLKIRLPETTQPQQPRVDIRLLQVEFLPDHLTRGSAWIDGCTQMKKSGVALSGETVYAGSCPEFGLPFGIITVSSDGRVMRAVRIEN